MSSKDQRHPLSYRYYREKNSSRSLHPRPGRRSARCTSARTRACVRSAATRSSRAASVTSARASRRLFHGPTHRFFKFEHTVFFFFFFFFFQPTKSKGFVYNFLTYHHGDTTDRHPGALRVSVTVVYSIVFSQPVSSQNTDRKLGCSAAYSIYSIGGCYTCYIVLVYYTIVLHSHSVLDANFGI